MPPVYLTPKSSAASPDRMAVCPIPPRRNDNVKSYQNGPMNVPKLKLSDFDCDDADAKLGFFLAAPSDIPRLGGDNSDDEALSSFIPIERAHRSRSVPTIKIRPRPSLAFAGTPAHKTSISMSPISTDNDNDKEVKVTLTSSAPFVTRLKAKKSPAAVTPVSKRAPSLKMKNPYKLTALNNKRLKVRSPVTINAAAAAARVGTRLPSSTSRAA